MQERPMGAAIWNLIPNVLLKHKIDLEHWRAQVFNGESAMTSKVKERRLLLKDKRHMLSLFTAEVIA